MLIDDWVLLCQILAIGFVLGLIFGDFLDVRDPVSWKYWDRQERSNNDE